MTSVSRFVITAKTVASIWALSVHTAGVGWAAVPSLGTFVNIDTRIITLISPPRHAVASVWALCVCTPRVGRAAMGSLRTLVNVSTAMRTLISPTRKAVASVWACRIDTSWLDRTSVRFIYTFIHVSARGQTSISRIWVPAVVADTVPASSCVYTIRVAITTVNAATAFVNVHTLELWNFLPSWIAHTIITSKSVDTCGWIGTPVSGKEINKVDIKKTRL